ncbi:hypothetical protein FH972_010443 [Carpinus fangiana]|uniref:Uncharacterized protein n=1 Tax=Carpinus fangiana TaxID=176857 RepID=A0A660KQC1_9ROSI|nr:hypothetical protein FH972_010443 [Carpinus fangiana]
MMLPKELGLKMIPVPAVGFSTTTTLFYYHSSKTHTRNTHFEKKINKNKPILELLVANGTPKASTDGGGCGGKTQSEKEPPVEEVVRDMGLDGRGICR